MMVRIRFIYKLCSARIRKFIVKIIERGDYFDLIYLIKSGN